MVNGDKYPIKYAVMEICEQTGWTPGLHELGREYEVVANIVSKVYLVSETTKYLGDGTSKKEYSIVFPYQILMDINKRKIPEFNFYGQCYNAEKVEQVFESYDDAKKIANQKNDNLRSNIPTYYILNKDWLKKTKEAQNDFDKKLSGYLDFEQLILSLEDDMVVNGLRESGPVKKLQIK